ncbi:transposase [Streptomyces sp. KE1]|uniref:transposase n=1 Tax=Streptomyces TaxID=1883 RepID=UPI00099D4FAC
MAGVRPAAASGCVAGRERLGDRRALNGTVWKFRTGTTWRGVPARHGPWATSHARFAGGCGRNRAIGRCGRLKRRRTRQAAFSRPVGSMAVRGPGSAGPCSGGPLRPRLGVPVLADWPSSSQCVVGTFFSLLSPLFDGLSLISSGTGGRGVVSDLAERERGTGRRPVGPVESGHRAPSAGRVRSIGGILRSGTGLGAGHSQHSDCGSHRGPGRRRDRGRGPEHG